VLAKADLLFTGMYYSPFTKIRDCEPERFAFRLAMTKVSIASLLEMIC